MVGTGTGVELGLVVLFISGLLSVVSYMNRSYNRLEREFLQYKLHVAETYMAKNSGAIAINRVAEEVRGMSDNISTAMTKLEERLAARIDKVETAVFKASGP